MRSQNRKLNNAGRIASGVSGGALFLLTFLMLMPVAETAEALEESASAQAQGEDAVIMESKVGFTFSEPIGVSSLTPLTSGGASAQYLIQATVDVVNSGGYTVYLGSKSSDLTGKKSGATINGVTGSSTYEDLPVNTWGYNAAEGTEAGTSFRAVPTNNRGDIIGLNDETHIEADRKTFTLSFAARIGKDKPADTYENEITLSVVSGPLELANGFGIGTMQEMKPEICQNVEVGTTARLQDARDLKYYWVRKMPDNQCWMVQNLDLDLGDEWPEASLSDYDVASTEYKPVKTAMRADAETIENVATSTRSWSLGDYVIRYPERSWDCSNMKNGFGNCGGQFMNVARLKPSMDADFYSQNEATYNTTEYDAHYFVGNHYQWNTATAGTGGDITEGEASGSICPKGWKLPTSNNDEPGSFGGLINTLTGDDNAAKLLELTGAGYFFVRGGGVYQSSGLFGFAGAHGYYWSSTPTLDDEEAYYLNFGYSANVVPSITYLRSAGLSVRCLAR